MNAFLLTWNESNFGWDDYLTGYEELKNDLNVTGVAIGKWSCGNTTKIKKGDRIFLMRLGAEKPNGIVASGYAESDAFKGAHYNKARAEKGDKANRIYVRYDKMTDYKNDRLDDEELKDNPDGFNFHQMSGGVQIPPQTASWLEEKWEKV